MWMLWVWLTLTAALAGPVADGLAAGIATCKEAVSYSPEEGPTLPPRYVFEPKNGYATAGGSYPACGCECDATAAAYRAADGSYRYLSRDAWSCEYKRGLTGADWAKVLPGDLRATLLPGISADTASGVVALDAALPRVGTTTTLQVVLVPIGLDLQCPGRVCDRIDLEHGTPTYMGQGGWLVSRMIKAGVSQADLEALAMKGPGGVSESGQARIASIGTERVPVSADDLAQAQAFVLAARARWTWVQQLTMSEIVLQWNREEAVFTIDREKSKPAPWATFLDYLREVQPLALIC